MMSLKASRFIFAFCLLAVATTNVGWASTVSRLQFKSYSIEDGLSQSTVHDIAQDHLGFIWLATSDGLNMFDGYNFKVFKEIGGDAQSLDDSNISMVAVGPDGTVWVGTPGPVLNRLLPNRKGWERINAPLPPGNDNLTRARVTNFAFMGDSLLAGIFSSGLLVYDTVNETQTWYQANGGPDDINDDSVLATLAWDDRYAWVGTNAGLQRFDVKNGTFETFDFDGVVPTNASVTALARIGQSDLLAWIFGGGMVRIRVLSNEAYQLPIPTQYQGDIVNSILPLEDGSIWLAFNASGIGIYDSASATLSMARAAGHQSRWIQEDQIQKMFRDKNGLIWLGTYSYGAHTFHPDLAYFKTYRSDPEDSQALSDNLVLSFEETHQGYIWIGTQNNGINRMDPIKDTFEHYRHDPNDPSTLSSNRVASLFSDEKNVLWAGTGFGLNRFDAESKTFRRFLHDPNDPQSIGHNSINDMLVSEQGDLWIATFGGGLQKMDREKGTFERFPKSLDPLVSPGSDWINDITLDSKGNLWIGTDDHGLTVFDTATSQVIRRYDEESHLSTDAVSCLLLDDDIAWIGTYGGGLMKLQISSGEVTTYREQEGMPNDTVYGILKSNQGHLWMSTNKGLARFDPETEAFWNFTFEDGLQSNEYNYNAYFKAKNGELYFGGVGGFNRFDPADVVPSAAKPEVVLTSFRVFNQEVELDKAPSLIESLELTYQDRVIAFSFAATDYVKPRANQFAYRLEGFNDTWINNGTEHSITYTNLDSGEYLLQIKAANSQNVWSEDYLEIPITMNPPLWLSVWAFLIYGLIIAGIMYIWIRTLRQKASQELNQAINLGKAEFATTVLHNIANVLNSLRVSCDQMIRVVEESRIPQMQRAHRMLVKNLDNLDDFLKNDPKGQILPRYFETANDVLSEERIEIRSELDEMNRKIRIMKEIIETQQSSAKVNIDKGSLNLNAIIEEALTVQNDSLLKFDVLVKKNLGELPPIQGNKIQMVHIMINLIKNAIEAVTENRGDRIITITTMPDQVEDQVILKVSDTGVGIAKENLDSMFKYGFTTKASGHGFGLNYCAKSIKEMGGSIKVESDGVGEGATFLIRLKKSVSIPN